MTEETYERFLDECRDSYKQGDYIPKKASLTDKCSCNICRQRILDGEKMIVFIKTGWHGKHKVTFRANFHTSCLYSLITEGTA